ncbi:restriction endonuclease PLD domain-containing protein [Anaerosporobacter sp.]|uniref:restriction endonuclease PLD domain-containing protein n=1 Tax=Anaerosporobacter sp. TaxID=1872529 RepID=UPI00286F21FA|nr:restriction endonuclease PLD domain-containing protein [Anaerosporobacter sp.]
MFIDKQNEKKVQEYYTYLKIMGSLSKLFSDNSQPYIDYRVTENLFCMCLDAKNLSRSDCTADASKDGIGVGIKTFLNTASNSSMQKVAEFNSKRKTYAGLETESLIRAVSELRNERIDVTMRMHGLDQMIYHCTVRDSGKIHVLETKMDKVNIEKIEITPVSKDGANVVYFTDGVNEYSFNNSKSVLYKRFDTKNVIYSIDVEIIDNPYLLLKKLMVDASGAVYKGTKPNIPHVYLPLYSIKNDEKYVPEKSGLNQWNASGRKRNENELYISIPSAVHKKSPDFFPERDCPFNLELPDGTLISAKVCQDGSKALMSNPNSALGEWLLRKVLNIKEGQLVTYEQLAGLNIDSVVIHKKDAENYSIDFTSAGKYEDYFAE